MNTSLPLTTVITSTFDTTVGMIDDANGSLVDDWENYKAYTRFYYISDEVFLYANPILIIIGIPTHALSMIIFLRKRMCRYPVSVFMAMLSLTNILILAGPVTMQWLNHKQFMGFVVKGPRFLCAFHVYIDLVGSSINSWLILMIAVERYLSVTKPFLIRTSFNRRQAWIIVLSVFIVALIAPLGLVIVASKVDGCLLFFSKTYQIIGSIQIFFIYVLPSILILTLSIITVHKLRNRIRSRGARRIHISIMLIGVSFSFIIFTMPYQICWYWLFSTAIGSVTLNLKVNIINVGSHYLALTFRNLNYTLNFFLYSLTSIVFLKEAFTIAHCDYFLDQTFVERSHAFRRVRRLFSEPRGINRANDEQQQQQTILINRRSLPNNIEQQQKHHHHHQKQSHNYHSFAKHMHANGDKRQQLFDMTPSPTVNGNHNRTSTTSNVSFQLQKFSSGKTSPIISKKLKWNLKPMRKTSSSNHLHADDDQHQQQLSSGYSSTSNVHDFNNRVQE